MQLSVFEREVGKFSLQNSGSLSAHSRGNGGGLGGGGGAGGRAQNPQLPLN